ncbi:MAG: hypothetical protein QM770_03415 [Tepidisphaeraceae bacterium]
MSVTIDDQTLPAEKFATVGDVLAHASARNRLVVSVTIDGRSPDFASLDKLRAHSTTGHAIYVETSSTEQMVHDICDGVEQLLSDAESMRIGAIDHLQKGEQAEAFRKLAVCFNVWSHSQESVTKLGQLMRLDLDTIQLGDTSLAEWLTQFASQLLDIRTALESRDFVQLSDILSYEADRTNQRWTASIQAIRARLDGVQV